MSLQSLLTTWSLEPFVIVSVLVTALLYLRGVAYTSRLGLGPHLSWWQITCFFAGLLVLFIALESDIDVLSDKLLFVHMIQHDLLTMVVPPLLLLGMPAWVMWRAFPAVWRRVVLLQAIRYRWPWRAGQVIGRALSNPPLVFVLFVGGFLFWHIP